MITGMNNPIDPVTRLAYKLRSEYRLRQQMAETAATEAGGSFCPDAEPDFAAIAKEQLDRAIAEMALERLDGIESRPPPVVGVAWHGIVPSRGLYEEIQDAMAELRKHPLHRVDR